jgi:hypothetical protein
MRVRMYIYRNKIINHQCLSFSRLLAHTYINNFVVLAVHKDISLLSLTKQSSYL